MEDANMPRPTPIPVREAIYRQWQQGRKAGDISNSLSVPERTVRNLIERFSEQGEAGIAPSYSTEGQPASPQREELRQAAADLRRAHPEWGRTVIQIKLKQNVSEELKKLVPGPREVGRWLAKAGLAPAPRGRRPQGDSRRADAPHERWQMDAAEEITLADGSKASWLRIADEHTGAVLFTRVFSLCSLQPCLG